MHARSIWIGMKLNSKALILTLLKINHFHSQQTKGGQVQSEGAKKLGQMLFGNNDEVLSVVEKVYAKCSTISDPDRCEVSFKRMSCARDTAQKYGLTTPREMI